MGSIAHFITNHEQSQLKQVCYFRFLMYTLLPKNLSVRIFVKCRLAIVKCLPVLYNKAEHILLIHLDDWCNSVTRVLMCVCGGGVDEGNCMFFKLNRLQSNLLICFIFLCFLRFQRI